MNVGDKVKLIEWSAWYGAFRSDGTARIVEVLEEYPDGIFALVRKPRRAPERRYVSFEAQLRGGLAAINKRASWRKFQMPAPARVR